MAEPLFVDGLRIYKPRETAPKYIIANCEIVVTDFKNWIAKNQQSEKIRIVIKESQGGKLYAVLDTYDRGAELAKKPENLLTSAGTPIPFDLESKKQFDALPVEKQKEAVATLYGKPTEYPEETTINPEDVPF
jgi:hypothetical protein